MSTGTRYARALFAKPRPRRLTRRRLLIAYAIILVPAVAGAALDAPLLLTLAAVVVTHLGATRAGVLIPADEYRADFLKSLGPTIVTVAIVIVAAKYLPERYLGLILVGCLVATDVVWRLWTGGLILEPSDQRGTSSSG